MEWTPENIRLLRIHIRETQKQFADRLGLKRQGTISEWEAGKERPSGIAQRLLDITANDAGFTERVAARLRVQIAKDHDSNDS